MSGRETLPVVQAGDLDPAPRALPWLVEPLWLEEAVGIIGGAAKVTKSWMGIDLATSVASGTPCLDHFPVEQSGRALIYMAEDSGPMVRRRLDALCEHRSLDIHAIDLHVITAPVVRLDLERDRSRLANTVEDLAPRVLLLDPLVRMHRCDENSAMEMAALLSHLRELQRRYHLAIILVHHASKRSRARPGQALRGSSDLHAFGDCNAYMAWNQEHIDLTLEHRAAPTPDPLRIRLCSKDDGSATHLELVEDGGGEDLTTEWALHSAILRILEAESGPMRRATLRERLHINNQRLGRTLESMEAKRDIVRTAEGWIPYPSAPQDERSANRQKTLFSATARS